MAAAIPGVGAVTELAEKAEQKVEDTLNDIGKNPVAWVERFLLKWGSIVTLAGVVAYGLYVAGKRASQGYLNDIDQTLGIPQESKPTPPAWQAHTGPAPPPPPPPQQTAMNGVVSAINAVGTTSASANVTSLQGGLAQLWTLAAITYGCPQGGTPTQAPPVQCGQYLAVAIMQTAACILALEGQPTAGSSPYFSPQQSWYGNNWGVYSDPGATAWLIATSRAAMAPYKATTDPDWGAVGVLLSNRENNDNLKETLNALAQALNLSQPFDLASANSGGNAFGVLGVFVADLSGVGAQIAQAVQTAASDVNGALATFANDVTEVGQGLAIIGRAFINLPRLAGDGLGYVGTWGLEMVGEILYPFLLGIGLSMLAIGATMRWVRRDIWPKLSARLRIMSDARQARLWLAFDRRFGIPEKAKQVWEEKGRDEALEAASLPPVYTQPVTPLPPPPAPTEAPAEPSTSPTIDAGGPAEAQQTELEEEGEGATTPGPGNAPPQEPATAPEGVPEPQPEEISHETPTPLSESPVPPEGTTEAAEEFLGEHPTRAPTPEELAEAERNRIASLPPIPEAPAEAAPEAPPAPPPAPTYRQRKEERDQERAERFVRMGMNWDAAETPA